MFLKRTVVFAFIIIVYIVEHTLVEKYIINTEIIYIINKRYMNYKYLPNMVYKLYTIHSIASSLIKMSIFDLGKSSMLYEPQLVAKKNA